METKTGLPAEALAKAGPKDVFLNLLSIIALYVSVGSFIALIFQYINVYLPDKTVDQYYSLQSAYSSMRWSIALLIVVFPVYIWTNWFLSSGYQTVPQKKGIKIRKWLVYFTLFAAGIIIIGDVVALIYNFLQGELTARFLLKILAILVTALAIFWYYFAKIRNESTPVEPNDFVSLALSRVFSYIVIFLVAISIISGFFVVGSPKEERARKSDEMRVANLQFIQSEIVNFWIQKNKLPAALENLQDDIRGITIPKDSETMEQYLYEITGPESFKLCATFNRASMDTAGLPMPAAKPYYSGEYFGQENWAHASGNVCFTRTIDKDRYKPEKPR